MNEVGVKQENGGEILCENLYKIYNEGKPNECRAVNGLDFTIEFGQYVSIIGPSGSGKSTLLNLISVLDTPTKGEVYIEGVGISTLDGLQKARLRREKLGFIFQQFNLIPSMTAFENIALPMRYKGVSGSERQKRVQKLLELVELDDKAKNKPPELSGGQKQRVAIARGLANDPAIILGDEPTGNLDQKTGVTIMDLLRRLNREEGKTLIVVTHDPKISSQAKRQIKIVDGKIV
ncbi:MAG: ABC transporter ATP-binding protein [Candidatus Altiarchaeota archaeon]